MNMECTHRAVWRTAFVAPLHCLKADAFDRLTRRPECKKHAFVWCLNISPLDLKLCQLIRKSTMFFSPCELLSLVLLTQLVRILLSFISVAHTIRSRIFRLSPCSLVAFICYLIEFVHCRQFLYNYVLFTNILFGRIPLT